MKRLLREPLIHFLVAGLVLFVLAGFYGDVDGSKRSITIDDEQVTRLAAQWQQTWRRAPSGQELDGLIRDYIKEEIYFREAVRLGLDEDDPVIRRRLRNKMEFLATSAAENSPPSDAELIRYYAANKIRYAEDAVFSFDQKFYGEDESAAQRAVAELNAGKNPDPDPITLPAAMEKAPVMEIARKFGEPFAVDLHKHPTGKWTGPVKSGYGWHAVRIRGTEASNVPPLKDIFRKVSNDWRAETRFAREAAAYQALLDGYDIHIKKP